MGGLPLTVAVRWPPRLPASFGRWVAWAVQKTRGSEVTAIASSSPEGEARAR